MLESLARRVGWPILGIIVGGLVLVAELLAAPFLVLRFSYAQTGSPLVDLALSIAPLVIPIGIGHYVATAPGRKDRSPQLLEAVFDGDTAGARRILELGVDANAGTPADDVTPLMIAAQKDHLEILDLLLARESTQRNRQDRNGVAALSYAAEAGNTEAVRRLLAEGVHDLMDGQGMTALMHASKRGSTEIVEQLLGAGVSPTTKDAVGRTALDHAANPETAALLSACRVPCSRCPGDCEGHELAWSAFNGGTSNREIKGYRCRCCGSAICASCKKRDLRVSFWSGWDEATCPECDDLFGPRSVFLAWTI